MDPEPAAAADVLIQLWYEDRQSRGLPCGDWSREEWDDMKDLYMSSLSATPCLPDSDAEIICDEEPSDDGKMTWKYLRKLGWSYVPGSRLGDALIDLFYLPPGIEVEAAIKYKTAFCSMDQVQAYLTGEPSVARDGLGKRRRDGTPTNGQSDTLDILTPRHPAGRHTRV